MHKNDLLSFCFKQILKFNILFYSKRSNSRRVRRRSTNQRDNGDISIKLRPIYGSTLKTPTSGIVSSGDRSRSLIKIGREENSCEENDITLELNDDDFSKKFKLEKIQSTNIEDIERKIKEFTLEDDIKLVSPRKRNLKEATESQDDDDVSMNYIEASGEILFSKKSRRLSS